MTIASIVLRLNYELVGSAATAERALVLAEEYRPEVVVMDLSLRGGRDGVETARAILARHPAQIVFLTASGDVESVARMRSVGPCGILLKPFRRTELTRHLTIAAEAARRMALAEPARPAWEAMPGD